MTVNDLARGTGPCDPPVPHVWCTVVQVTAKIPKNKYFGKKSRPGTKRGHSVRSKAETGLDSTESRNNGFLADMKRFRPFLDFALLLMLLTGPTLTTDARVTGGQTDTATERFGFRSFEFIEKGPFFLNGRRRKGRRRHSDQEPGHPDGLLQGPGLAETKSLPRQRGSDPQSAPAQPSHLASVSRGRCFT